MKPKIKGRASWKPAALLDVVNKEPGYRYRWVDTDEANVSKKLLEQWEPVKGDHTKPDATTALNLPEPIDGEGNNLYGSFTRYRDCILMRIPEEIALERDEYYAEKDRQQYITPGKYKQYAKGMFAKDNVDSSTLYDGTEVIE